MGYIYLCPFVTQEMFYGAYFRWPWSVSWFTPNHITLFYEEEGIWVFCTGGCWV